MCSNDDVDNDNDDNEGVCVMALLHLDMEGRCFFGIREGKQNDQFAKHDVVEDSTT